MHILGLDFETTFTDPVDPKQCRIIEVGAVLWDTELKIPLSIMSEVIQWPFPDDQFDPRITELTGLTLGVLRGFGLPLQNVLVLLRSLMTVADAVIAHNGNNFDRPVLAAELARNQMPPMPDTLWLDSQVDIPYPKHIEARKLKFLGPEHGFINPFAHRALFDVVSMLKIMSHYDINEIVHRAKSPKVRLRALTEKPWNDGGRSNASAKERGFKFDGELKLWIKTVLADDVEAELNKPGTLKVVVLQ